jgi:hypothetical protein
MEVDEEMADLAMMVRREVEISSTWSKRAGLTDDAGGWYEGGMSRGWRERGNGVVCEGICPNTAQSGGSWTVKKYPADRRCVGNGHHIGRFHTQKQALADGSARRGP